MITIKRYIEKNSSSWDRFINTSNNGTIFHLRKFINYHPNNRFKDHSLEFYKKNTLLCVFPAAELTQGSARLLVSHPGTSFGSFVFLENLSIHDSFKVVEMLLEYSKDKHFDGIKVTLPPIFYYNRISNYIDFSLLKNGFNYIKREVTSTLYLESKKDNILNNFRPSHARAVKKAIEIGVDIQMSNDVKEFYKILKENLKIRHGVSPTHSIDELYNLIDLFPNSINIFSAYYKNEMIAGILNIKVKDDVSLAFYISHKEKYQDLRPLNLLFYSVFKWAIKEKIKVYDFGIFTIGGEPNMGLGRFKENFGASGIFRDTLQILF